MIALDNDIWNELNGGYLSAYNPVKCLMQLYENVDANDSWKELWDELHHQGDVDQASYAAVPHILEIERRAKHFNWNGFALIAVIEQRRPANAAPRAGAIADGYQKTWNSLLTVVANHLSKDWDDILTASILSCVAYSRGQRIIACAALELNERIARDFLAWHQELEDEDIDEYINGG